MLADLIDYRIDTRNIARIGSKDHQRLARHHLCPGDALQKYPPKDDEYFDNVKFRVRERGEAGIDENGYG